MTAKGSISIIDAIEDPRLLGSLFKDQATWESWKVFLAALFGLPLQKKGLTLYRKCTGRKRPPGKRFNEAYAIVGRRGGKSFISAVVACFLALFHDWTPYLSPGEVGWIMVIASDRQQARVILGYIKAILQLPMFKKQVQDDLAWEIRLNNRVTISIKTCDYRTIRGFTTLAVLCDEMAFWRSEGTNPAKEIITAIRPSMATIPGSLLLAISTPYARSGPLYEAFRKRHGKDRSGVLVWTASTRVMNATIPKKLIDDALRDDFSAAKAEWLAEFREDLETFLPTEMIEAAIVPGRFALPKVKNVLYRAFTDPSGGRADSFCLAIAHREAKSERIVLDRLEEKRPPFGPQDVINEFSEVIKEYGIREVTGDRYAGEFVTQGFRKNSITFKNSELDKSSIYLEFEPMLAQGQAELLENERLRQQLRGLERRTRSGGKDRVDHYPGGHDDLSNTVAGACVLAKNPPAVPMIW